MQVGLMIGYRGPEQDAYTCEVFNVAVVVEETIMLHNFEDVLFSFAFLIGIILKLCESGVSTSHEVFL